VPRKIWPILMLASFSGFVVYDLQAGVNILSIIGLILADTIEVLTAALGISYSFRGLPRLNSLKALARYSFFAVIVAPVSTASVGALALHGIYWSTWRTSYFSEALALLTLTPAILGWAAEGQAWAKKSREYYLEAAMLLVALSFLGYITLTTSKTSNWPAALYSIVPLLLWSALRFGSVGVSTSMIVVALFSVWGAVHGRGPFIAADPLQHVLSLQVFLLLAAAPFMVLAAVVEERKQTEEALRDLSGRLIHSQEEERCRLARELHDDFNQRLAMLAFDLETAAEEMKHALGDTGNKMHDLWNEACEIGADLHSLSHQLHSSTLESLGLVPGISSFCTEFTDHQGIEVDFAHEDVPRSIAPDVALCLFRIVQEALRNVKRHSCCSRAHVTIENVNSTIHLRISDEGVGFNENDPSRHAGLGIRSMEERLRLVGGRFEIRTRPMEGTRIDAWVPLKSTLTERNRERMPSVTRIDDRSTAPVRVLVVEDFEPFRQYLCSTLGKNPELHLIGEVSDGLEAVDQAEKLQPDLILLDVGLPSLNGIEAARRIRKLSPESRILFVSQESSADAVQGAINLGALGYVVKARAGRDLLAAVEAVRKGRHFVSSGLSAHLTEATD
jgi:signal transduction histidine kinase/AmiR/NasT family two-component response regulator